MDNRPIDQLQASMRLVSEAHRVRGSRGPVGGMTSSDPGMKHDVVEPQNHALSYSFTGAIKQPRQILDEEKHQQALALETIR